MQISMRRVSDIDTVDRIFNPHEDTQFRSYLRDKYERTMEHLEKVTTGTARDFLDRSRRVFEEINSSAALRKTRAAIRSVTSVRRSDVIYKPEDLGEFQAAGFKMQRFLMADPDIRRKFVKQQIDGYSHAYVDVEPGSIGENHYDYRRVVDGVFFEKTNTEGEVEYTSTQYFEKLTEGDRDLDVQEQFDIIDSWYMQRAFQAVGVDTTSLRGDLIT